MRHGRASQPTAEELRARVEKAWCEQRLNDLLTDLDMLIGADPDVLLPLIEYAGHLESMPDGLYSVTCRASRFVFSRATPEVRRWLLAVHAARLKTTARIQPPAPWHLLWAGPVQWNRHFRELSDTLTGRAVSVRAGNVLGRAVALVGYEGGVLRLWDLVSGTSVIEPASFLPWEEAPDGLALGEVDGRLAVIACGGTGVWLWEPDSGRHQRLSTLRGVRAMCIAVVNRRPALVMARNGALHLWDLRRCRPLHGMRLSGDIDGRTLAVTRVRGRPVAVTGNARGALRMWDLASGNSCGVLLPESGRESSVTQLTTTTIDGRPVVLTGSQNGRLRIWDLAAACALGEPWSGHRGPVTGLDTAWVDRRHVAVSAGWDGTVRVWDLPSGRPLGTPLTTSSGSAWGLTTASVAGRPVAVTGAHGPAGLQTWDLAVRTLRHPAPARREPVTCLTAGPAGEDTAVVAFTRDWRSETFGSRDPATGEPVRGFATGEPAVRVRAVATGTVDGQAVAVTGDIGGGVTAWSTRPAEGPLALMTGHKGSVRALAVGEVSGREVVASAGEDGTVRLWDLRRRSPWGKPLTGHTGPVTTVQVGQSDGRTLVISGGEDGTIRLWNPEAGEARSRSLAGHVGPVWAVAVGEVSGREVVASAGEDGTVRLWDLRRRSPWG
ncbi:WD40 repeat domain-containing protein, partial [Streptomyces griseorubiginosus]|uniref:WD40 repeat domain-containing protein n=1 Tax=Streptomyces griseorubiginosus TaxID=67304 RepID=UPI0036EBB334